MGFEVTDGDVGADDLDGPHSHGGRRLEIDPEIIQKHAFGGYYLEQLAGDLVKAGFGLAAADFRTLDHGVEPLHDRFDGRLATVFGMGGQSIAADHVVGEAGGLEAGRFDEIERLDHFGANVTLQQSQDVVATDLPAQSSGIVGKGLIKLGGADVVALEMGPGVVVGVG